MRNHKRIIKETLQQVKDMGMSIEFDNYKGGNFTMYTNKKGMLVEKTWANTVTIDGMTVEGLQAWDNSAFTDMLMPLLKEYAKHEITLEQLCNRLSGKNISAITVKQDGSEVKEYAKDSYHWSQVDLIDRFYRYIDKKNTIENLKAYFTMIYEKTQACNPNMDGWTADRVEQVYLTHAIIPSFIKNELNLTVSNNDLKNLIHEYLYNWNDFSDSLHRLNGDKMVQDDYFYRLENGLAK